MVEPTIFREYIGAKSFPPLPAFPDNMINDNLKEFHFILAFATESYVETKKGTGNFEIQWDASVFTPASIKELKEKHPNVKVVFSIGGRGSQYPFNPRENGEWLQNALTTLRGIISQYKPLIDGIDVNYEHINSGQAVFVDSIGKLIKSLKTDKHLAITVASIAPSQDVDDYYRSLYGAFGSYIDWVDYQFYDENDEITTPERFVERYQQLSSTGYGSEKLLAGFSVDPTDPRRIEQKTFLDGCKILLQRKLLRGIFAWDAEDSSQSNSFEFEKKAQKLLLEFSRAK